MCIHVFECVCVGEHLPSREKPPLIHIEHSSPTAASVIGVLNPRFHLVPKTWSLMYQCVSKNMYISISMCIFKMYIFLYQGASIFDHYTCIYINVCIKKRNT